MAKYRRLFYSKKAGFLRTCKKHIKIPCRRLPSDACWQRHCTCGGTKLEGTCPLYETKRLGCGGGEFGPISTSFLELEPSKNKPRTHWQTARNDNHRLLVLKVSAASTGEIAGSNFFGPKQSRSHIETSLRKRIANEILQHAESEIFGSSVTDQNLSNRQKQKYITTPQVAPTWKG